MFANPSRTRSDIACPTCSRPLCWPSRTGKRVSMICHPDRLDAPDTLLPARAHSPEPLEPVVMTVSVRPPSR
jgi:hypothetical protein